MTPTPFEWPNLLPEWLDAELQLAEVLDVRPSVPGTALFDEMIGEGTGKIKWVVTPGNELLVIAFERNGRELPHTIASEGRNVLAAGEADIVGSRGQYFGIELTHLSGHYQPEFGCLEIAREAFRRFGIEFPA